jgi:hypothetical protein
VPVYEMELSTTDVAKRFSLPLGPGRGIVAVAFAYKTWDPGFESRQDVRFLGIAVLLS